MKTIYKIKYLFVILFTVFAMNSFAQANGPGDPGGDPGGGSGGDPLGGGAPVSGGTIVLLSFALIYGSKKVYELSKLENQ